MKLWRDGTGVRAVASPALALTVLACLLASSLQACGRASGGSSTSSTAGVHAVGRPASDNPSNTDFANVDRDKDNDNSPFDDTNNRSAIDFGHPAGSVDRQAIVALLKRYFAAALAQDGAGACSMLYSTIAEASPEDYGVYGAPYLQGAKTCAAVMLRVFKYFRKQIVAEAASLKVGRINVEENHGLAILSFGKLAEKEIGVRRERRTWKVTALLDGELP